MAEQITSEQNNTSQNANKVKKKSAKSKKKNREMLILPEVDSVKEKIIISISEVGKQKEYFTNDDIFSSLVGKMQVDMNNIKKIKSLYSYIVKVTSSMEKEGYLKGYHVPGSRKVYWKLVKPPF